MSNTVLQTASEKMPLRYDTMTIVLHWSTVSLVVVLWILGQTSDWWPRGPLRDGSWSLHVTLGFVLAAVLLTRIIWRIGPGRALPSPDAGMLRIVARGTHLLLYGLLLAVVGLGITNAFVRGYTLFEAVSLPQIGDRALRRPLTEWHGLAANAILIVALLHAAAGLFHQYIRKDHLLWRMWHA
jgi:cytochrome b561